MNIPASSRSTRKTRLLGLFSELIVVFVGVYAAFALNTFQEGQKNEQRRLQILEAMHQEFENSLENLDKEVPTFTAIIDSFLHEYEKGEMPEITHLHIQASFRSDAWESMLGSGGLDLLDVNLILQIESYYGRAALIDENTEQHYTLSAAMILPNVDAPRSYFYDLETQKLKRPYSWYIGAMEYYKYSLNDLRKHTIEVLNILEMHLDKR